MASCQAVGDVSRKLFTFIQYMYVYVRKAFRINPNTRIYKVPDPHSASFKIVLGFYVWEYREYNSWLVGEFLV